MQLVQALRQAGPPVGGLADQRAELVAPRRPYRLGEQVRARVGVPAATGHESDGALTSAASRQRPSTAATLATPAHPPRGVLVIIDYAERWPTGDLLTVLAQRLLAPAGIPVRALLLARAAGYWWHGLRHHLDRGDVPADEVAVGSLADTPDRRRVEFTTAVDAFAAALDVPVPTMLTTPAMRGEAWRLVLTTHMAALAVVDAHRHGDTAPTDPVGLSTYLLNREAAHWQALYDNHRLGTPPQVLGRAAFVATLTGPMPHPAAVTTLAQAGMDQPGQVTDDHHTCYPSADPAPSWNPFTRIGSVKTSSP